MKILPGFNLPMVLEVLHAQWIAHSPILFSNSSWSLSQNRDLLSFKVLQVLISFSFFLSSPPKLMPILCFVVGWYRASGGSSYFAVAPLYAPQLACRLLQGCETLLTFRCTSSRTPVYPAGYDVRVGHNKCYEQELSKDVLAQLQYRNQSVRHLMLVLVCTSTYATTCTRWL